MTAVAGTGRGGQAPWDPVPAPVRDPSMRVRIRQAREASGNVIAVLDDDPTGSQAVHDVQVVTLPDPAEYASALSGDTSTCFVLTNSRSLTPALAADVNDAAARHLYELAQSRGRALSVVSRSDSTLRGHVLVEVGALNAVRSQVLGRGFDAVLLAPAFIEAGRVTAGDTHWARVNGEFVPVGDTEFAKDVTFGYRSSDLREFVGEISGGAVSPHDVVSLGLEDIRVGGPERITEILMGVQDAAFVVVNAVEYSDLEVVVLGVLGAEACGKAFLFRTGPSFVRALDGQEPQRPLDAQDIWPAGAPGGHGLVVVGSHVGQTSRQVEVLVADGDISVVELDVATVLAAPEVEVVVEQLADRVRSLLPTSDVLLLTSRRLISTGDPAESLDIARRVSAALAAVVRRSLEGGPSWVVGKGGITSHDVALHGLGIRRAQVVGQLFDGVVSLLRPVSADPRAVGVPYVVFAGNVGDDRSLLDVVRRMRGHG